MALNPKSGDCCNCHGNLTTSAAGAAASELAPTAVGAGVGAVIGLAGGPGAPLTVPVASALGSGVGFLFGLALSDDINEITINSINGKYASDDPVYDFSNNRFGGR